MVALLVKPLFTIYDIIPSMKPVKLFACYRTEHERTPGCKWCIEALSQLWISGEFGTLWSKPSPYIHTYVRTYILSCVLTANWPRGGGSERRGKERGERAPSGTRPPVVLKSRHTYMYSAAHVYMCIPNLVIAEDSGLCSGWQGRE